MEDLFRLDGDMGDASAGLLTFPQVTLSREVGRPGGAACVWSQTEADVPGCCVLAVLPASRASAVPFPQHLG